jgi:mitochondrial ATPase complex subunit ATP10
MATNADICQNVRINIEEDGFRALLVQLFMGRVRRQVPEADWDKYFLVRKGISDEIREGTGMLNSKVGYTYLLDANCKFRWAGSGPSEDH